jgi:hypothetical protein
MLDRPLPAATAQGQAEVAEAALESALEQKQPLELERAEAAVGK